MPEFTSAWSSYPKVFALGHSAIKGIFSGPVICQEKVDGSFVGASIIDGELRMRSKGAVINLFSPEKMFAEAVTFFKSVQSLMTPGWMYCGEYLKTPGHNAIHYDRIPLNHIALFDIKIGNEDYASYELVCSEAVRLGMDAVPLLYSGMVTDQGMFRGLLRAVSFLGGHPIEGVVVKNYAKYTPDGKAMMGKFVSEEFKEELAKVWGEQNPGSGDILERMVATYSVPARWAKAVQHLREQGKITDAPADLQHIIPEIQKDIMEECKGPIMEEIWKWASEHIRRRSVRNVPGWYKDRLLKKSFENTENGDA